jgi:uncharacterized protein (DUF433 family)
MHDQKRIEVRICGVRMSTQTAPASWIQSRPNVCGGAACIRDTRITVWGLAVYRRLGLDDVEIMRRVHDLTSADLALAWTYCDQHAEEIDLAIRANEGE